MVFAPIIVPCIATKKKIYREMGSKEQENTNVIYAIDTIIEMSSTQNNVPHYIDKDGMTNIRIEREIEPSKKYGIRTEIEITGEEYKKMFCNQSVDCVKTNILLKVQEDKSYIEAIDKILKENPNREIKAISHVLVELHRKAERRNVKIPYYF